jgi:hypothetical protein
MNLAEREGGSALAAASHCGCINIVWLLLENGADTNLVGKDYDTVLAAVLGF